jgi:NAD+ kinase
MNGTPRVLVASKETRLTLYQGEAEALARLEASDQESLSRMEASHQEHFQSLGQVEAELTRRGWPYALRLHTQVEDTSGFDLVLTVGGDGTVLNLSHKILSETPLLGVNSSPSYSVGYFCGCDAAHLRATLDGIEARKVPLFSLCRLWVLINGARCPVPVLNDLLITDVNPAATSRYVLQLPGALGERQRSSGVWISTSAGSTAAIRSAGGSVLPLRARLVQYLIREPYLPKERRYHHLRGVQELEEPILITSLMDDARVYLDGPHNSWPLALGDVIEVRGDAPPLLIYGLEEARRFV